ncbi:PepSY domain-containing protein [Saccharibacillus qingshengii]|uniref:PepSY domain-containing protein n=1 Tax=Saccharibacillus qingshengii TaxID=1763540 RepID=UPI001556DD29|nr:PepSY domain-containing protein [Saccharibacillus qingshengii]
MKRRTAWAAALLLAAAAAGGLLVWSPWSSAEPSLTPTEAEKKLLKLYSGQIESARQTGDLYEMQLRTEAGLYTVKLYAADGRVESIRRLEAAAAPPREIISRSEIKARLERQAGVRVERLELDKSSGESRLYAAELTEASGERRRLTIDAYTGDTLTDTPLAGSGVSAGGQEPDEDPPPQDPGEDVPSSGGTPASPDDPGGANARLLSERQAKAAAASALGVESGAVEDSDAELRSEEDGQAYYLVDVELKTGRQAEVQINAVSGAMQTITWDEEEDSDSDPPSSGQEDSPNPDEDSDQDESSDEDT